MLLEQLFENFIHLFLESAPWLLLGLVLAGLLKVFVPMAWMQKQLGGHGFKTVLKAAILGAPLPLCSCGVIPAAIGLRRAGASKAATTSFLVSTPETGVDSVTVSYVLLGPFMAIVRPIAAITSAIVAGLLVGRDDKDDGISGGATGRHDDSTVNTDTIESVKANTAAKACCSTTTQPINKPEKPASCCNSKKAASDTVSQFRPVTEPSSSLLKPSMMTASTSATPKLMPVNTSKSQSCSKTASEAKPKTSCCASTSIESDMQPVAQQGSKGAASCCASTKDMATELKQQSIISRIASGLHYGATDLVRDTTLWLLVGLFFAALVQTYVPGDFLAKWGDGVLAMLVMVLVSVPMYICATASTPIAAGLLLAGVSPGAVLVFMMAGPATNIATLGVVSKELGKRALLGYLGGVLGVALIAGMLVNYLVATFGFEVMPQIGHEHQLLPQGVVAICGIILALLMAKVVWDKIPKQKKSDSCCS
ncbi:SO_0444 family Cu/Zn efflux transporter [Shewanella aestuarii]|uniref:SO_0444 family Cu/Zn efflux transporter n=1 Tax=Shewanella aestuarii TaxID=1028752 RepID=A0A6G9QG11_9GAMM|nr:SO_0444 family Cu/Zn efflux transporter [Shewanella aestuarii]QIR13474.1 SO_0444 family Cu/Zn efflux transporter [Shewanella aestuarii]